MIHKKKIILGILVLSNLFIQAKMPSVATIADEAPTSKDPKPDAAPVAPLVGDSTPKETGMPSVASIADEAPTSKDPKPDAAHVAPLVGDSIPKETGMPSVASINQNASNNGIFASLGAYCTGAIGGATATITTHPVLAAAGGAAIVAAVVWTVYLHKIAQRVKTLEQELDELESAA